MQKPSGGHYLVAATVLAVCALAFVPFGQAGTQASPEVTDAANDQAIGGATPAPSGTVGFFGMSDILKVWLDNETATGIRGHLSVNGGVVAEGAGSYTIHLGAADHKVVISVNGIGGSGTPPGVSQTVTGASNLTYDSTTHIYTFDVLKSDLAPGASIAQIFAEDAIFFATSPATAAADSAPDSGFGHDYNFTLGTGGNSTGNQTGNNTSPSPTPGANQTSSPTPSPTTTTSNSVGPSSSSPAPTTSAPASTSPAATTSAASSSKCEAGSPSCFTSGSNFSYTLISVIAFLVLVAVCLYALLGRWAL